MDKEIYRGPFFLGGEIGHIPVDRCAPRCACGGVGCLERYVGNRAIMAQAKAIFKKVISLEEISILAKKGEPRAVKIWQEVGARIGFALAGIVNVFNPEVIVVGGGVAEAGDILLRSIKKTLDVHAMKQLKGKIKIKKAILGNDAGVLGAALLVRDQVARDQRR
jgi:predicted NBD/HSP70 family sugar kinase